MAKYVVLGCNQLQRILREGRAREASSLKESRKRYWIADGLVAHFNVSSALLVPARTASRLLYIRQNCAVGLGLQPHRPSPSADGGNKWPES